MYRNGIVLSLLLAALPACGDDGGGGPLPAVAPTGVTLVVDGDEAGFESPLDAVSSPDGATFYFSATASAEVTESDSRATIYSVPSAGGEVDIMYQGAPLREPTGLLMSCDGATLYIADIGFTPGDEAPEDDAIAPAAIYTLDVASGTLAPLAANGIGEAASLALAKDCDTLFVSGYTPDRVPAVFSLAPAGGTATVIKSGDPLVSPSGVYVDADKVIWLMDHQPDEGLNGKLFAITQDGETTEVASELRLSEPAGVSLIAAGGIAVIPTRDENDVTQLITVDTATMDTTTISAPEIVEPSGIRTAISAPVMVLVDADGHAIYRVE
jgi:sugar lactone lactonase YvrE